MNKPDTAAEQETVRILIIEDEPDMLLGLEHNLKYEGFAVTTATNGRDGLEAWKAERPDLVLLDIMLPEMNGFDVLEAIRQADQDVPVILITAKGLEMDKVRGFGLGADDYVTKPFSVRELLARITAVLRRSRADKTPTDTYAFGDVEVDFNRRECRRKGREVALSYKEFELLKLLVQNRGQTVTRERLLEAVSYTHLTLPTN